MVGLLMMSWALKLKLVLNYYLWSFLGLGDGGDKAVAVAKNPPNEASWFVYAFWLVDFETRYEF